MKILNLIKQYKIKLTKIYKFFFKLFIRTHNPCKKTKISEI